MLQGILKDVFMHFAFIQAKIYTYRCQNKRIDNYILMGDSWV